MIRLTNSKNGFLKSEKMWWGNIKNKFFIVVLLSFFSFSPQNYSSVPPGREPIELLENKNFAETNFCHYYQIFNSKQAALSDYNSFNFKIFQLQQNLKVTKDLIQQERIIHQRSYINPLKKIIAFSVKLPFPLLLV